MFRSNLFGAIAGALIAMDGLSLVLARTAILDVLPAVLRARRIRRAGARPRPDAGAARRADRRRRRPHRRRALARPATVAAARRRADRAGLRGRSGRRCRSSCCSCCSACCGTAARYKVAGVKRRNRATAKRSLVPALGSLLAVPLDHLPVLLPRLVRRRERVGPALGRLARPVDAHLDLLGLSIPWTLGLGARPDPLARAVHASTPTASTKGSTRRTRTARARGAGWCSAARSTSTTTATRKSCGVVVVLARGAADRHAAAVVGVRPDAALAGLALHHHPRLARRRGLGRVRRRLGWCGSRT